LLAQPWASRRELARRRIPTPEWLLFFDTASNVYIDALGFAGHTDWTNNTSYKFKLDPSLIAEQILQITPRLPKPPLLKVSPTCFKIIIVGKPSLGRGTLPSKYQ
jgi:hypothetical protein